MKNKNSKVFNMVEKELHAINEVKDASISLKKFNKVKTYADKLLKDKDFSAASQLEYKKLVVSEKIAELRHAQKKKAPYERQ
jgi:hypothetical protein